MVKLTRRHLDHYEENIVPKIRPKHLCRCISFAILAVTFLSGSDCGSSSTPTTHVTHSLGMPISLKATTPPTCGSGEAGAPAQAMNGTAAFLADLINADRSQTFLGNLPPNNILTGVAQFHAEDMAKHGSVGLIASDGEDPWTRVVCSGGPASTSVGVIAIGYSTDPQAVLAALNADTNAFGILYGFGFATSLSVGYSDGYWMILVD